MANLLRKPTSKDKDRDIVGRFKKPDGRCKRHPKHRQSPGVCSLCLTEKLHQLSSSGSRRKTTFIAANSSSSSSVSSLSSYYSSSSASSCASPVQRRFDPGKSTFSSSISFFLNGKHRQLTKSRTVAVVPGRKDGEGSVNINKSNKNGGFWHKLLHPKSKRVKENVTNKLVHSTSVTENVMAAS